ncbi:uncharacterized protein N7446_005762 [Penicillium canescens]|uniref:Zn(2)-C6 fungal-type domain-containing protein n=1 Tax=Penicillium canescens TaxID=5083 RepID=A0AAD6NC15_PENCN|nr:uncharacterized protein N7446_005762 [Penicillium canescens]KAJ6051131.1 hypothetical protein N7460_001665 [Penicillium canescens]KAJ6061642.1 hypothetical protein N7446_005762 [Penicillium canescens]
MDENARARRRRTERGPRSKNGCGTCLLKKVKCDEHRPRCHRCGRLQLECEWPTQPPSLSSRRRGLGPIKNREDAWAPPIILPKSVSRNSLNDLPQAGEISGDTVEPPASLGTAEDRYRESVHINPDDLPSPDPTESADAGPVLLASGIGVNHAPSLGSSDTQAVLFHRTVFAPLKSTRKAASSAHCLFLGLALQNAMTLHFLLAVSHNELAIHLGFYKQPPQESWNHLQHGSRIFLQALNPLAQLDHVGTMLSFLYMYMFWMRRNPFNLQKLRELSASVLTYVKSYNLDELCAGSSSLAPDALLLSRILTYLYDRDGFCGFFGCGGSFASYVSENLEKRHRIWQLSRSIFTWSDEQTIALRMPGIQGPPKSYILKVYFELIAIHHDINCYSQAPEVQALEAKRKIKRSLAQIQEQHKFLRYLITSCRRERSSPPLMALVTVTFFHAIQIYFYRSRDAHFGQLPVTNEFQYILCELIAAAYYTVATGPVQLLERFQWSLLIAGIETYDPIHLKWILETISDPVLSNLLSLVKENQKFHSVSMEELRYIIDAVSHEDLGSKLEIPVI